MVGRVYGFHHKIIGFDSLGTPSRDWVISQPEGGYHNQKGDITTKPFGGPEKMNSAIETRGLLKEIQHKPIGCCGLAKNSIGCDMYAPTSTDKFDAVSHCLCKRLLFILKLNIFVYVFRGYPEQGSDFR